MNEREHDISPGSLGYLKLLQAAFTGEKRPIYIYTFSFELIAAVAVTSVRPVLFVAV